jgi:hypothetical protein
MVGNGRIRVALSSLLILTTISAEAFDLDLSLGVDEGGPEW